MELHLKSLILDTELLYEKMDKLGYLQNGILSEKISDNIDNTHNLEKLFGSIKPKPLNKLCWKIEDFGLSEKVDGSLDKISSSEDIEMDEDKNENNLAEINIESGNLL